MNIRNSGYTIQIATTGLPDTEGLRIRAVKPFGIYLSMGKREAAKYWFERYIVEFVMKRKLVSWKPGGGVCIAKWPIDWNALFLTGTGEISVRSVTPNEGADTRRIGTPVIIPNYPKPCADWWEGPAGDFVVIRDKQNEIDSWIVESIERDLADFKI
ncbi:MAG: hypothetical protein Q7R54_01100 [bacterium]|nr:hypothetical protein [bacterium]